MYSWPEEQVSHFVAVEDTLAICNKIRWQDILKATE